MLQLQTAQAGYKQRPTMCVSGFSCHDSSRVAVPVILVNLRNCMEMHQQPEIAPRWGTFVGRYHCPPMYPRRANILDSRLAGLLGDLSTQRNNSFSLAMGNLSINLFTVSSCGCQHCCPPLTWLVRGRFAGTQVL